MSRRNGQPAPNAGQPLLDRLAALREPSEAEWECPRWLPWLFVGAIAAVVAGVVALGWAIGR